MCDELPALCADQGMGDRAAAKAGFEQGTIVGADKHLTGNLRGAFPNARVMDASIPPEAFPRRAHRRRVPRRVARTRR